MDQNNKTAPTVRSGSTLFVEEAPKTFQQTTKADDYCDWHFKG